MDDQPDRFADPLGGELGDFDRKSAEELEEDGDYDSAAVAEAIALGLDPDVPLVRPPPAYPDGLHDAAKADRTGPFWSSLGEPDVSTGPRPAFLRRDDWHFSSTYTPEQRAQVAHEEAEYIESVREVEVDPDLEEEAEDIANWEAFFDPPEYMKLEDGPPVSGGKPSEHTMPNTWQEYQALQAKVGQLAAGVDRRGMEMTQLSEAVRSEAAGHEQILADFYETFKDILAQGWTLLNNRDVEAAVIFVEAHYIKEED